MCTINHFCPQCLPPSEQGLYKYIHIDRPCLRGPRRRFIARRCRDAGRELFLDSAAYYIVFSPDGLILFFATFLFLLSLSFAFFLCSLLSFSSLYKDVGDSVGGGVQRRGTFGLCQSFVFFFFFFAFFEYVRF